MVNARILIPKILLFFLTLALFLVSPTNSTGAEVPEIRLSLAKSIKIALSNTTSAKKAENNLKLQGADLLKSYGSFLPQLSATAGYTPYALNRSYSLPTNPATINTTTSQSVDLTVTTTINLFNGFRDYSSLQSALKREHAAEYTLSRTLESVIYDITQTWYQVLLDRELLEISQENLLSVEDQLKLVERQFQVGLKSITDLYQQQAEVEQSRLAVMKAQTRMERTRLELLRRLRIDPLTKISLETDSLELTTPSAVKPDREELVNRALDQRSDLKSKAMESNAAQWQVKASRASRYPSVDLALSVSSKGVEYLNHEYAYPPLSEQMGNTVGYSARLNLNWAIFDGFQTRYAIESAKINQLNQQLDYEDLKKSIVIDLYQAAGDYASAYTQIETAQAGFTAARSAFNAVNRKYELGAASFVELSAARATLFNARSNLSQATYNLALQKSVLDFTTGSVAQPQ
ncbi:MAG: TolC family protein [Chlorobium sp.]|nr:MAG: TolC family protein [Chlorobium sp.]